MLTQTQTQPKNIFSLPMPSNGPFQESRYPRSRMQVYGRAIVFRGKGLVFRVTVPTLAFGFRGAHDIRYSASLALWVNLVSGRSASMFQVVEPRTGKRMQLQQ